MRIHVASASFAVSRTLEDLILGHGYEISAAEDADWMVVDKLHPVSYALPAHPCITLGIHGPEGLTCPFRPYELARWLAQRQASQNFALNNGWQLDRLARALIHPNLAALTLTEKEAALLGLLANAHPQALMREALLTEIWGITHELDSHTLDTHLYRLRHKLASVSPLPCDIVTEEGAYKIVVASV